MQVDLKALRVMLAADKLGMASPERLKKHLGVEPGAVTLLGLINDSAQAVELVFDRAVWTADAIQCHPLVNTSTLVLARADVEQFLQCTDTSGKWLRCRRVVEAEKEVYSECVG